MLLACHLVCKDMNDKEVEITLLPLSAATTWRTNVSSLQLFYFNNSANADDEILCCPLEVI